MKTNKIHDVYMAFWKIKFDKKKINLFKDVCMFTLTESWFIKIILFGFFIYLGAAGGGG